MKIKILGIAALALLLPFAATSCSDDDKKISSSDISSRLQEEDVPKAVADCMAPIFADAGLTEGDVKLDEITDLSKEKQAAVAKATTECAGLATGSTTAPE